MASTDPPSLDIEKILSIHQQYQKIIATEPYDYRLKEADLAIFTSDSVARTELYLYRKMLVDADFKETCGVCRSNQLVLSRNQKYCPS